MKRPDTRASELVCIVDAITPAERPVHFALIAHLFGERAQEKRDLTNGYAFRFPPEAFDQLAQFASKERRCCPFLSFEIVIESDDGPLWLHMTGPEGTREFLAAELPGVSAQLE